MVACVLPVGEFTEATFIPSDFLVPLNKHLEILLCKRAHEMMGTRPRKSELKFLVKGTM